MQPDLLDYALRPAEIRKRRPRVRDTSKLAVTVKRDSGTLQKRAGDVAHWLAWHRNFSRSLRRPRPTTVELAVWVAGRARKTRQDGPDTALGRFLRLDPTAQRNYIARGIWDCQDAGLVEAVPNGTRLCSVNKRKACTWRLRTV